MSETVNVGGRQRSARSVAAASAAAAAASYETVQVPVRSLPARCPRARADGRAPAAQLSDFAAAVQRSVKPRSRLLAAQRVRALALRPAVQRVAPLWATEQSCIDNFEIDSSPELELLVWEVMVEALGCACVWAAAGCPPTMRTALPLPDAVAACAAAPLAVLQPSFVAVVRASKGDVDQDAFAWRDGNGSQAPPKLIALMAYQTVSERRTEELAAARQLSDASVLMMRTCAQCGHESHVLHCCALCRHVWFCDKACQTAHWRAGHRRACTGRSAVAASAAAAAGQQTAAAPDAP
jgi:hypothetical protein